MGTTTCKSRATSESEILPSCVCASRGLSTDFDQHAQFRRGVFDGSERAEHAEIARLIEALARPPADGAVPEIVTEEPPVTARCWERPSSKKQDDCVEDDVDEGYRDIAHKRSPGLSVLDLVAAKSSPFKSCSADRLFELMAVDQEESELPEAPNSSLAFNRVCSKARNTKPGVMKNAGQRKQQSTCFSSGDCTNSSMGLHLPKACSSSTSCSKGHTEWDGGSFACSREDTTLNWNVLTLPQHLLGESSARNCMNGSLCVGQWKGNLLDGYGIERWPDGSVFIGDFWRGKKHGDGRLVLASGSSYEGEFLDDAMHGEGLYLWKDGRGYSGQWVDGDVGPQGRMRWSDGRKYEGNWHEGHMHGYGTFQWPDGRHFAGQWVAGRQHGTGVIRNVRGSERQCLWKEGVFARWLSAPCGEEGADGDEGLSGNWEVSISTPRPSPRSPRQTSRSSPERGLAPRWSPRSPRGVGEASFVCDDCLPLDVESCSLGLCKANGERNIEL